MKRGKVFKKKYDTNKFNFYKIFYDHINKKYNSDLPNIHTSFSLNKISNKLLTVETDQSTNIHKFLYEVDDYYNLKSKNKKKGLFIKTYEEFIKYLTQNIFKEDLIFQSKPTIRVHQPKNLSVGAFHRDSEYNHPEEEYNIWVPLTRAFDTSTIWIEKNYLKEDYFPFNSNFGEFAIFDGNLKHGNKVNEEKYSRISFDFRIIKSNEFKKINKSSVTQNIKFKLGSYYSLIKYDKN